MSTFKVLSLLFLVALVSCLPCAASAEESGFSWPISCVPGIDCAGTHFRIGYPDVGDTGLSFACSKPGYPGHQGTDIVVSSVEQGVRALAAADGVQGGVRFRRLRHECQGEVMVRRADGRVLGIGSRTAAHDSPRDLQRRVR